MEEAESKLMRDMAFMKMQHQELVEQLKNNYNAEVYPSLLSIALEEMDSVGLEGGGLCRSGGRWTL